MIVDMRVRIPPAMLWGGQSPSVDDVPAFLHRYLALYNPLQHQHLGEEALLAQMKQAGVAKAVVQAEFEFGDYRRQNEAVQTLVQRHADKFVGFVTVDPAQPDDPVQVVSQAAAWGAKGVNLQPWAFRRLVTDEWFYPLYEYCQQHGLIVSVHTGINFSVDRSIDFGRPLYLDQVACEFPNLKLIANHGSWPWVNELVAVAWKHPHVYLEIGGIAPKYLLAPGSGWEPLLHYGSHLLREKVVWATDWPLIPFARSLEEFQLLPWSEETKQAALGANALRLLGESVPGANQPQR